MTWQQAALWLFNIEPLDLDYKGGKKYDLIFAHIFSGDKVLAHFGRDARKVIAHKVRLLLAKKLVAFVDELEVEREAIERRELLAASQTDSQLIERPEYIEAIWSFLEAGRKIICIWGEPGTGKTVLANQAAEALCGGKVLRLRADDRWREDDLIRALVAEGIRGHGQSTRAELEADLKHVLSGQPSNDVVVIDNVTDEQLLEKIVPDDPKIPVLVTMRRQLRDARSAAVELHDFTEAQADHFIQRQLPDAPELERLALARVLGCRPLALEHAVLFAKEAPDVALSDLINKLTTSVSDTLPTITAPEDRERELVRLYNIILEALLEDADARSVLDGFLAVAGINGSEQRELVYAFMHSEAGGSHERLHFRAGLRTLMRYGLLRETAEDDPGGTQALLSMHHLTGEVLRGLRAVVVSELNRSYIDLISSPNFSVPDDDEPGTIWLVLRAQAAYAVRDTLLPGWRSFQAIDPASWQAVRELRDETGALTVQAVRYDVFPHGVFAFDYQTGERSPVTGQEAGEFFFMITAYTQRVMALWHYLDTGGSPADWVPSPVLVLGGSARHYQNWLGHVLSFLEAVFMIAPFNWDEEDLRREYKSLSNLMQMRPEPTAINIAIDQEHHLHGVAYGHTLFPGMPWCDNLEEPLPPDQIDTWSQHTFILRQVAVAEEWRGQGIGRRLIEDLLLVRPEERATVAVPSTTPDAFAFFTHLGWRQVGRKRLLKGGAMLLHDILMIELHQGHD